MQLISYLPYLLPLFALVGAQDTDIQLVKYTVETANIPFDLSILFDPTDLLEVTFPQNGSAPSITLKAGDFLNQNQTGGPPTFSLSGSAGTGPFVIAAVDPDAPTPVNPTEAQIRHFLGGNFTAGADGSLTNSTPAITEFLQPNPPLTSTAHRYVFLVFEQSDDFSSQTLVTPDTSRDNFNISAFAAATGLGSPLAGTYMEVNPVNSPTPPDV
ncbi:PEBP-like protein [Lentinula aff. detonsa]|uniref:PEBP-like protein n=1 Tax=Lentinula aff. detonsa TaxID=2804958 RepID=A0AA38TZV3_9AGAR|nr:PEBP-like protein [Lentinula aff. detonsa]